MNTFRTFLVLLAILVLASACTKKDNLTGTNWSELEAQTFEDANAVVSGFSFSADSLVSISTNRKSLLVGSWQGSTAKSILRFTGLPADTTLASYSSVQDLYLDLVLLRRNQEARNPLSLKFYKVETGWTADPDSLNESHYTLISTADTQIPASIVTSDTMRVALPNDLLLNWQTNADSTGLNILIMGESSGDAFVELRLATAIDGSKLRYRYKETAAATEFKDYSSYATKDAFSFSHPEASVSDATWKLSNFNPQRMFIDLQPDYTLFKDDNGLTLSPENLKRMNINKAELVLYIKKDLPNLSNTYSYFANAFLVKESPEAPEIINTTNLESIAFAYPLINSATNTADSLVINITPIMQAYTSGKKEAKGIVIISTYERKDFGEIEFYHPLDTTAPEGKQPYIRVKYTPPFL